ncbi:hypothetical protein BRADI_4g25650v3 [Brachypodium distachyon]|uniref:Plant heme peroxidase family profile domain-containing protein n=1 Tax=Brachypodium distachyon TaxID=15368 RepID=I1INI7_BRADI|nr:hypothetical protein BRADI_4g25650v3 [Brachypodium distachyon]
MLLRCSYNPINGQTTKSKGRLASVSPLNPSTREISKVRNPKQPSSLPHIPFCSKRRQQLGQAGRLFVENHLIPLCFQTDHKISVIEVADSFLSLPEAGRGRPTPLEGVFSLHQMPLADPIPQGQELGNSIIREIGVDIMNPSIAQKPLSHRDFQVIPPSLRDKRRQVRRDPPIVDRGAPAARATGSRDNNLAPLDLQIPTVFENAYYKNLVAKKGLMHSDRVREYVGSQGAFFADLVEGMVPLTGSDGQIRKNCIRRIN